MGDCPKSHKDKRSLIFCHEPPNIIDDLGDHAEEDETIINNNSLGFCAQAGLDQTERIESPDDQMNPFHGNDATNTFNDVEGMVIGI